MSQNLTEETMKPPSRKYYCETYTDKPWGLETHIHSRLYLGVSHFFGAFGLFKLYTLQYPILIPFSLFYGYFAGAGVTLGAHRYWTHKSYKAKLPLQLLLAFMQTAARQFPIFKWCRDHRIHHKYVDTESDPYNSTKGFWYSHIIWLIVPEPPAVKEKQDTIDLSDLDNDPVVRFQAKYYWYLTAIATYILPMSMIRYLVPGISWFDTFCMNYSWYLHALHFTFLVNSAAHLWGYRPYDKGISPRENKFVSMLAIGEGGIIIITHFHMITKQLRYNWSTMFLDFFAWIGWAYDLKTVPSNVVKGRARRTGDGSNEVDGNSKNDSMEENEVKQLWGWGDVDMTDEDYKLAKIYNPSPNTVG